MKKKLPKTLYVKHVDHGDGYFDVVERLCPAFIDADSTEYGVYELTACKRATAVVTIHEE